MIEISFSSGKKISLEKKGDQLIMDGVNSAFDIERQSERFYKVFKDNKIYDVELIERIEKKITLAINGKTIEVTARNHIDQILSRLGMNALNVTTVQDVKAPMPGKILLLSKKVGDKVEKGDQILILEAMKMENVIKSSGEGVIKDILIEEGENVDKNQLLITLE